MTPRLLSLRAAAAALCLVAFACAPCAAGDAPPAAADAAARTFLDRCAGCHSVGGGARSGPDLLPASAWKPADLSVSVKRMEKNAGPLKDEEVTAIVEFLKDPGARDRIATEEARVAKSAAAALEPPSPATGRDLFWGRRPFANGGSNCAACHAFEGSGGTLGPSLATTHARLGDVALASAFEKSAFNVMRPIYAARPVTKQEAAHVTAYLASAPSGGGSAPQAPLGLIALGASGALLAVLGAVHIRRKPGTRARLVAEATRR